MKPIERGQIYPKKTGDPYKDISVHSCTMSDRPAPNVSGHIWYVDIDSFRMENEFRPIAMSILRNRDLL